MPASFNARNTPEFGKSYMTKLFDLGRQAALRGDGWRKTPPGCTPEPSS
jgi:hypothetical protein